MWLLARSTDQILVTDDDYSPVVNIVAIFFAILSSIAVAGRTITKLATRHAFVLEDVLIISALVASIAQSTAVVLSTHRGIARRGTDVSIETSGKKAFYASGFLFLTSLILSKSALVVFMRSLVPVRTHRWFGNTCLCALVALWVAAIIVHGTGCNLAAPWDNGHGGVCYDLGFWDSVGGVSIATDAALVIWPVAVVARLRLPVGKKFFTITCFASRLFALASMAVQVAFQRQLTSLEHTTFDVWKVAVMMQITLSVSIITSSTPHLTTFFGSLASGMLRVDDMRRRRGSFGDSDRPKSLVNGSSQASRRSRYFSFGEPLAKSKSVSLPLGHEQPAGPSVQVTEVLPSPVPSPSGRRPTIDRILSAPAVPQYGLFGESYR